MNTEVLHVNLIEDIDVEGGTGTAQSLQNAQPFDAQRIAASGELGAGYRDIVESVVVSLIANGDHRVANETVTIRWTFVELTRPLWLDPTASPGTVEYVDHKLRIVHVIRRCWR